MSCRWWTSDLHLGHANICRYCRRPWLRAADLTETGSWIDVATKDDCARRMNEGLIRNMNGRIKPEDTVIHVGDFCCKGNERGESGTRTKGREWEARLNGKWIHINGNHDPNNGLKFGFRCAVVELGGFQVLVQHRPVERACEIPDFCNFVVCGHVHEKWPYKRIDGVLNINVGVDARRFMPVSDTELLGLYARILKEERKT